MCPFAFLQFFPTLITGGHNIKKCDWGNSVGKGIFHYPDVQSSISRTHRAEGKSQLLQTALSLLHLHTHTQIQKREK